MVTTDLVILHVHYIIMTCAIIDQCPTANVKFFASWGQVPLKDRLGSWQDCPHHGSTSELRPSGEINEVLRDD